MPDNTSARPSLATMVGLLKLLRPKQWIKNSFVLAPLVFSGEFLRPDAIFSSLAAAVLFCVASSAVYVVNDICDIERDKRHPVKALSRPLAAGIVTVPQALTMTAALYAILAASLLAMPSVTLVLAAYLAVNMLYNFVLKYQPVLDIFTIATGFVLRVYAGAVALNVPVSAWMFVTTLCLALFLAAVKRRQELAGNGIDARKVLEKYSAALVNRYAEMASTGALVFYGMFVMSARPELVITVPLVLFGLFRYWYIVDALDGGESPTDAVLSDWQLLATVLLWSACCVWAMWPAAGGA